MIPLWKGKNPIYFGVIRSKVNVTITINIIFDNKHTLLCGDILFLSCPSVHHTVCQRNSSDTTEQNFMKLGR